jgi:hypothetical protein
MRTHRILLIIAALALATPASATHLTSLDAAADCDGWSVNGTVWFGSTALEATVDWTVELLQDDTATQTACGSAHLVVNEPYQNIPFADAAAWDESPCGSATVRITAVLTAAADQETLTTDIALDCPCDPPAACYRSPGYWKNHDWPVPAIPFAGAEVPRDELLDILRSPVRGDATIALARQLIAARLNVAGGGDPGIGDTIDDADQLLIDHPVYSDPDGDPRTAALALKDMLEAYNHQGCDCDDVGDDGDGDEPVMDGDETTTPTEAMTWSGLRDLYR